MSISPNDPPVQVIFSHDLVRKFLLGYVNNTMHISVDTIEEHVDCGVAGYVLTLSPEGRARRNRGLRQRFNDWRAARRVSPFPTEAAP